MKNIAIILIAFLAGALTAARYLRPEQNPVAALVETLPPELGEGDK